jgi:formylglycine-generating enzyme required for sulfatase activity
LNVKRHWIELKDLFLIGILAATLSACLPTAGADPAPAATLTAIAPAGEAEATPAEAVADAAASGPVKTSAVDGAEMVYVPAGTYTWGRQVTDLPAFWIDKYEVTNERFKMFMDAGGYTTQGYWSSDGWTWLQSERVSQPAFWDDSRYNAPQQPVVGISLYEADAYARWAGKRLPATLEWQAAAQGTDDRLWPWGETWDPSKANAGEGSRGAPVAVGSYPAGASPFGALDMAGNVWEYTQDWYRLRPMVNDEDYCAILSSSWDANFTQGQFCRERRSGSMGRFSSGGFRTAESDGQ